MTKVQAKNTTALAASMSVKGTAPKKDGILKIIRDAFSEDQGHDLRLTDDAIMAIVNRIGRKEFEELDGEEQMKLMSQAEEAFKDIAVSDPTITGIINRLDDRFNTALEDDVNHVIKSKSSAVHIFAEFKRLFSADELDAMPYPGTDADDVKGTNYKPDIVERPAVAGGKIRTVFTDDLVYAMPKGKAYQQDIDDVKKHEQGAPIMRLASFSKKQLKSLTASATQGRNAMRAMVRRALQLHHQLRAIEGMPKVSFDWIKGHDDKQCPLMPVAYGKSEGELVSLSPKPLWLMPRDPVTGKEDGSEGRDFSVSQVLAFDVRKALAADGSLAALVASAKVEQPDAAGTSWTPEQQDDAIVTLHANLSKRDELAAFRKRLVAPDQDDLKDSVCALTLLLLPIYRANEAWYNARINGTDADKIKADASEATVKALAQVG